MSLELPEQVQPMSWLSSNTICQISPPWPFLSRLQPVPVPPRVPTGPAESCWCRRSQTTRKLPSPVHHSSSTRLSQAQS